ncbi:MAG: pectin acetylesterase-family hydrolase [Candidatus Bipolaricaulia bacterium]
MHRVGVLIGVAVLVGLLVGAGVDLASVHHNEPMTLVRVSEAEARNAVCNDGTPATYYFRRGQGTGIRRWVIHLQGGGMCYSIATCQQRSVNMPRLMTSKGLPPTRIGSGVQSPSAYDNPDFFNANHVYVHYCSSDLWSGDRQATAESGGWHFRGARIVRAVIDDLMNPAITPSPNLADATEVLFSGGSAGGAGVMANLDWVTERLPHATVRGLNDAGWAVDIRPYESSIPSFLDQTQQGYALWQGVVDTSCAAANPGTEGRCYTEYAYPHISTPLFVQQAQFDGAILRLLGVVPPFDDKERAYMLEFAAAVRRSLEPVLAAFSPATATHSIVTNEQFWNLRIAGYSLRDVVGNWFFGRPGPIKLIEQKSP